MSTRRHILPPSTTALERAWDEALPAWGALADAFPTPSQGDAPAFLPWYAAEYGLAEFAPYFGTVQQLLAEGLPWLFRRGTAAGVAIALGWVGFAGATVEESGARLHINLGRPATAAQISAVCQNGKPDHRPSISSAGSTKITDDSVPAAEAWVCTRLFSRMLESLKRYSSAMEITAAGMAEAKVNPTLRPR